MPAVANHLKEMGWSRLDVEGAIDFTGVYQCLRLMGEQHVFVAVDGSVHFDAGGSLGRFLALCLRRYNQ